MRKTHLLFIAILSTLLLANSASMAQGVCDGVSPTNNLTIDSVVVATGLSQPLLVTAPPGDTDRIFIVQQHGVIQVKQRGTAANAHTTFLDIQTLINTSGNERGLLGMAFDPDYDINGYFYVNYTRSGSGATVVARFSVTVDPDVADPASVVSLLTFTQPQSNHNGGHLEFGTDGFLYIGTGDGGGANDAGTGHASCGNGLATDTMLGKILRIDPTPLPGDEGGDCGGGAALYGIPATNPLVDGAGGDCDEIFAWGLRNPWRFDFDGNGDLYIADVGQNCWEEVDYATPADADGNYGWRSKEGLECFNTSNPFDCNPVSVVGCFGAPACTDPSLIDPVLVLNHSGPCSITGGGVYRGCRMPQLDGYYFYGDYCAGIVRSFEMDNGILKNPIDWTAQVDPGGTLPFDLTSFGWDGQGEMYIMDRDGSVLKIVPPFTALEVAGNGVLGADQLILGAAGNWSWEDLEYNTMVPTEYYRVYRGTPDNDFSCIHSTLANNWATGDVTNPNPGELLAYLVTAVSGSDESKSGDPDRSLINPCAAP